MLLFRLIRIPALLPGSDQFTFSPAIKMIIGQEHVFHIVPDTLKFRSGVLSFYAKVEYQRNVTTNLFIKCEEHQHSPTTSIQICKEIFTETPSGVEFSARY